MLPQGVQPRFQFKQQVNLLNRKSRSFRPAVFLCGNVFHYKEKKQKQENILNWLNSLSIDEKLRLFTIRNKWLVNIFSQLFYIYYKMGNYSYKPSLEMCIFFDDQRKYSSKDKEINPFISLYEILQSKNITFRPCLINDTSKKKITKKMNIHLKI